MPRLSHRSIEMPASPIRRLAPFAAAAKARGLKVYHLNIGQPDLPTPQSGLNALQHVDRTTLEYSPSEGLKSYREKLTEYYQRHRIAVSADEIIVTTGGSEALQMALAVCLDVGDEVIIPEPAYANYMGFATEMGVRVTTVPTTIDNGFALPPAEAFEQRVNMRTRAIMICNPNNPTGTVYTRNELLQLAEIARRYDLFLIVDEVYREYIYSDEPFTGILTLPGIEEHAVLVDSVSKRYSECGIRVGALITHNKAVLAAALKMAQARLSPPLLGQIVAEASISEPQQYHRHVYEEYLRRRNCLIEGLNRIEGVYSPMPQGAFYTVASLPVEDADLFCQWCLTDFSHEGATIMMAPASGFYVTPGAGRNQVRLAYVLNCEDLRRAVEVLAAALKAYPGPR